MAKRRKRERETGVGQYDSAPWTRRRRPRAATRQSFALRGCRAPCFVPVSAHCAFIILQNYRNTLANNFHLAVVYTNLLRDPARGAWEKRKA
jgi:hypothetical protein